MSRAEVPEVAGVLGADAVLETAAAIARDQDAAGAIPWFAGGHVDVWDHVESAMALTAAGRVAEAARAYEWLRRSQRRDGSWPLRTRDGAIEDAGADSNHCAYVAVGVWHHTLVTNDERLALRLWPTVRRAIGFVLGLQSARGEVAWARDARGRRAAFALLAGSASVHHSLRCAIALAERLGVAQPDWELAAAQLAHAVRAHPEAFADRARYSMDWYYPVLGGAVRGDAARLALADRWSEFVVPELGVRCVSDRPWVTGAETCELALALDAAGARGAAVEQLAAMQHLRADDGAYWTGLVYDVAVRWPVERTTWTGAAVILAADALSGATPGSVIFRDSAAPPLDDAVEVDEVACGCAPAFETSADPVADALEHT